MRLIFWVTAFALLSISYGKNNTDKSRPKTKRQLDNIRTPANFQYSLVLPHSKVAQFRSINGNRKHTNVAPRRGKLPPYAVQMEPVVQYSQKDPLFERYHESPDGSVTNKNEIYAQPKILHVNDQISEKLFNIPFHKFQKSPMYGHSPHRYYESPEPIIEIIIKESNESLPAPPTPPPPPKKKKEPVEVFYVKYSKDPYSKDKVIYEKPIPAITPPTNEEDEHHGDEHGHDDYVTVTPEPYYEPPPTTTLRAIIKPESEQYHSDGSVKITFGAEGNHYHHYSDRREGNQNTEDHEETAPKPAISLPNEPLLRQYPAEQQRSLGNIEAEPSFRPGPILSQGRIQFQQPHLPSEQQLPRQAPSVTPFRHPGVVRQNPFGPSPILSPRPTFSNNPGPSLHFGNNAPTVAAPLEPIFSTNFPRQNSPPAFQLRPNNAPPFASRPHFNGPSRVSFHSGPQRPFHQPQPQPFFDEAKYLQENYHTITTEQIDTPKDQTFPSRPHQNYNFLQKPSSSPPVTFPEQHNRPQQIAHHQLLPQQNPAQQFTETVSNRSPFYNLKPSPPLIENNRPPFFSQPPTQQQQFSFHQGPSVLPRPTQLPTEQNKDLGFPGHISPSPSPQIPQTQFLPHPSSPTLFNFHPQPSPTPDTRNIFKQDATLEKQQSSFQQGHNPTSVPSNIEDQTFHQQNIAQFAPNGGELVAAIPKYEQHITVSGPTVQPNYNGFSGSSQSVNQAEQQFHQSQQQHQVQEQNRQNLQQKHQEQQQLLQVQQPLQQQEQQKYRQEQQQYQQQEQEKYRQDQQQKQKNYDQQQQQQYLQQQQQQQQQYRQDQHQQQYLQNQQQQQYQQEHEQKLYDSEQEQVKLQLAQNVQKQQDEIKRLQAQLLLNQQQHDQQQQNNKQYEHNYNQERNYYNQKQSQPTSARPQYSQERSRNPTNFVTTAPSHYQSTSRTVEIKPTTQKYVSSTQNNNLAKKEERKQPNVELPDEVPDDLRQQLLSSGILDNADISILDYDKVGETPLDSLPPDQLANFFSAGGGQHLASSENRPVVVKPNGDHIESRIDDDSESDQEFAASENAPNYAIPPSSPKQAVDMKVVHFDPNTAKGQNIASEYVKKDATQLEPVSLNDKKYNRYLPLKVSGNQFPVPDILKGRKITSVVVLAPVETEALNGDHTRAERATSSSLKGIKFIAGDSLQDLLKRPTKENFERWLETEKKTAADLQSVVLLVLGNEDQSEDREIFMYDITSGSVNKLSGELSNAFVDAAENNSFSKDLENVAIKGDGVPENFNRTDEENTEASENVPFFLDLSALNLDQENNNHVSISSGYSKTKVGRSIRRH